MYSIFTKTPFIAIRRQTFTTGLLALSLAASSGVWAQSGHFNGTVVGVTDGDTITVLDTSKNQHTIRLAFIDAPETSCHIKKPSAKDDSCVEKTQPFGKFGKASKKHLSSMIYMQDVDVYVLQGSTYGREIGVVTKKYGNLEININQEQVNSGMAWFYRQYAKKQLTNHEFIAFSKAEEIARKAHIGLWSDPNPVPPWEYRHNKKSQDNEKWFSGNSDSSWHKNLDEKNQDSNNVSMQDKISDKAKIVSLEVAKDAAKIADAGHDLWSSARSKMGF